jgi:hypothetical protein
MRRKRMKNKNKPLLTASIILIVLMSLSAIPHQPKANAGTGRRVDLFTQKTPYNGIGPNQTSDTFEPQELVILYALLTYNEEPVPNKLAAFEVKGPPNPIQNITVIGYSVTNGSGIAEFSFRIPWPPEYAEQIVFGTWYAIVTIDIAEVVVVDTVTFRVGWIVRIISLTTLNDQLQPQTSFLRQTTVVFGVTVENIANTSKPATITIDVRDVEDYPIIHIELDNLVIQPGESYLQASSQILASARIGQARAEAIAHTAPPSSGGRPYSPAVYAIFEIITRDITIISLVPSKTVAQIGEAISIVMTVRNKGNQTESFDVSTYFNQTLIEEKHVSDLPPSTETQVIFNWNTSGLQEGDYVISGVADPVEGEIEVDDNRYVDGTVRLYLYPPSLVHDVAVTFVNAQPSEVEIGDPVQITVRLKNLGSIPESFNVIILYDSFPITTLHVDFLAPNAEQNLTSIWDTSGMNEGGYTIKAFIPALPDEQNIANNWYNDGIVWIRTQHPPAKIHDIAVIAVNASTYQAYIGDVIGITVKAANLGDFAETSNITVFANMSKIGTRDLLYLEAKSNITLNFFWNTTNMNPGIYKIWAFADYVLGETNTDNNLFIDGMITLETPSAQNIHDIAVVSVQPDRRSVFAGETVTISVRVRNKGITTESFNVTLFYDSSLVPIQKTTVYLLPPGEERILIFQWNTSNIEEGNHTLSAYAEPVPGETYVEDNWFIDGTVEVFTHDIAVVFLSCEPTDVKAGENTTIEITVLNLGSTSETFNLTALYDSNVIRVIHVESLASHASRTITVEWNTTNVRPGIYTLSADASIVEGEMNIENNHLTDGTVTIRPSLEISFWTLAIPFLVGLLLILLLLLLLYYRRKPKAIPAATSRYVILGHPHI